jgi:hypothetical protein
MRNANSALDGGSKRSNLRSFVHSDKEEKSPVRFVPRRSAVLSLHVPMVYTNEDSKKKDPKDTFLGSLEARRHVRCTAMYCRDSTDST